MERAWLTHYDEGVPHTLEPFPECTLLDVVQAAARERPDHPALLFKGASLSYGELERLSDAFAAALVAQGVEKGDRVALLLVNSPQFLIGQLGAWKAGAIIAPMNPLYTERELAQMLNDCGAETAIVLTLFYEKVKAIQPQTSLRRVIATNIKEYFPPHLRILFTTLKEKKLGHRITLQPDDLWLGDLLRQYAKASRPHVSVGPQDLALLMFSGGTTGTPKGAVTTHQGLVLAGMQSQAWSSGVLEKWEDRIVVTFPMFHTAGNVGIVGMGLVNHSPLVLVPNAADLDDLIATIRQTRPSVLPGVPTLFIALLNHPQVRAGKVGFGSIKLCISGAAPLLAETKKRFETLTGGHIFEAYAMTESVMAGAATPVKGTCKEGSVGLPLPDVEIRIVDADNGHGVLPPGQVGEIVIRAPQVMRGYWQRPAETADTIREGPLAGPSGNGSGERWLFSGDLGYMDEDGYLFIVDRKKDLIKPSGFQVWPREVEEVIAAHPAVSEVGVAGIPDRLRGEAVKAWVVLREGQQATAAEIRTYCRESLVAYKVPRHVEFRDSLPKTHIGKVLRRELARQHVSERGSPPESQPQIRDLKAQRPAAVSPRPELVSI
jgi:long-chain acyl-CoA synthetase